MIFFYVITVIVSVVIIYLLIKNYKKYLVFCRFIFCLSSAIGNFIDRVRLGYVVDMLQTDFMNFPIFNVADSTLVVGVICIFIYLILDEKQKEGKMEQINVTIQTEKAGLTKY